MNYAFKSALYKIRQRKFELIQLSLWKHICNFIRERTLYTI